MSDLYSGILEGSCDSNLSGCGEKLHSVLKHDVGVVQGARRLKTVQDDPTWIEYSEADGYGDTGTKVIKIEGRILKSQRILEKKKKHSQSENKSMMLLLNWFCLQNRIPLLSSNIGQERSGGGRRSKSRSKAPTEDQNTPGGDGGADWNSSRKSQRTGKKGFTVGGAGGGKRPNRQSSTSEPDSAKSLQVSDSSEQVVSSSAEVSKEINDNNRKRKLKKHEKSENEEHTTNRAKTFKLNEQGKLPADGIFSSSTNLVQDHQKKSYGNESSSRRKKSKRKHDVVETSDSFSISKSSVSQSFEEKVRTGNSEQITAVDISTSSTNLAQNHPNKGNGKENKSSSRRKKSKRKQDVVETSDIFSIPTSSVSQSFQEKVQTGKSVQIEEPGEGESVNPAKNKQVKEYRRRSSNRKKLKSRKTLPQVEDPVLIINLSVISKVMRTERGNEWLEWTSSENEAQDEDEDEQEHEKKGRAEALDKEQFFPQVQTDLKFFLKSTKILDRINSILGLNPYTKEVRNNQLIQVKWVPRSGEYIGVCLNALLFFVTTISIFYSLVVILVYEEPLQTTKKIVKITFFHHFLEALFLMLLTLFLTIWAVSCILELGVHYAEFYNRFNLAICLTKYDVTEGIHEMIVKHLSTIFIFEFLIVILFFLGYFHTSIVRESCGFLGYTILRPFNFELRESIYYPLAELLGLILFLYCFLCLNVVLLHFAVYAKALENMARMFNLRMAYAFGSLAVKFESRETKVIKKVIPFKKLFAEHQIITSLIRNISHVNAIVFGAFIFSMICEIVLVMWLFFDMFLEEHPPFLAGVNIYRTGGVVLAVPLRIQKSEGERLLKSLVICSITWLTYWIFGGVLHNAGEELHIGIEYVRRQGLTSCKSSKERRFVLSMMSSFSSKTPYWIGRRFQFTRTSFVALVSFVIGASMVTVAFRPDRLSLSSIETCNEYGDCSSVKFYKNVGNLLYATLDIDAPSTTPQPIGIIPPTTAPIDVNKISLYPPLSFLQAPPCVSHGTYPIINFTIYGKLPAEWSFLPEIKLPLFYKPISFPSTPSAPTSTGDYVLYQAHNHLEPIALEPSFTDCYQGLLTEDSCGNPGVALPSVSDLGIQTSPPQIQLIALNQLPDFSSGGTNDERFFCCWKYAVSEENQVNICNMPSKPALERKCKFSVPKEFTKYVEDLKLKRVSGNTDVLASSVPFTDPMRVLWTNCLCKREMDECKKIVLFPHCFNPPPGTSPQKQMFTECHIPPNSEGRWRNVPSIFQPTIFQKKNNDYIQIILLGTSNCQLGGGDPPFPPSTITTYDKNEPIFDCQKNEYIIPTEFDVDDCFNPIMKKKPGSYLPYQSMSVIIEPKQNSKKVSCCVAYGVPSKIEGEQLAVLCNKPSFNDFWDRCQSRKHQADYPSSLSKTYYDVWFSLEKKVRRVMEKDSKIVQCLCRHIPYVKEMEPNFKLKERQCRDYILTWKIKG